ncbi:ParA family protein [Pseudoroseomonas ludipueritiae]|uniref:ParA family protein n=1 Tax=Pseudoroseomonas ludipueritiae TaxID=198093 RepID=A0ABR7RCL2_9PROT|nr:ParA family protein [Pseudoroseomonas ludipueritiae]MBC9179575.1 ParA family protein [Pseudoroseomonas ludipueritiae]
MQIITMASRKGGAGKTTLSCHLAVEAERCGQGPVAIIDTDDMAGLTKWWHARSAETPVLAAVEGGMSATLKGLEAAGFRLVIIDTPPALTQDVTDAVLAADLVLVPVQPSPDDLRAVGETVSLVQQAKKPTAFALNRVKKRVRLTAEAAVALSQYGSIAPSMIHDRTDYAGAKTAGLTAPEVDPSGPAAGEVAALWAYVASRLGAPR